MDLLNIQESAGASRPSLISSLWSLQVHLQNETNSMSLDMPINNCNSCYVGSQQSLPDMYMLNEEKDSLNLINQGDALINESYAINYYNNSNILSSNFRSVKSLSDLKSLVKSPSTLNNACLYSPMASNVSSLCHDAYNTSKEHLKSMPSTSTYNPLTQNSKTENVNAFTWSINKQNLNKINTNTIDTINGAFRDHYHTQMFGGAGAGFSTCNNKLSIQQRNNNICQWLQKLNLNSENDNQIKNSNSNNINFNSFEPGASRSITQSNLSMEVEMSP